MCAYVYIYIYIYTITRFAAHDLRPNGPNPRRVLRHYLFKKGAQATRPVQQILCMKLL